jgi:hypothetical protein
MFDKILGYVLCAPTMVHMWVVGYHLTYNIKDFDMSLWDYKNLMSQTDNHSPN